MGRLKMRRIIIGLVATILAVSGVLIPATPVMAGSETLRPDAFGDECLLPSQVGAACPNHWQNVDEGGAGDGAGTTVLNNTWASTRRDLYNVTNSGVGAGTILSVVAYIRIREAAGDAWARVAIKSGGVVGLGNEEALTGNFDLYSHTWNTPPEGGSWTWAKIDALQAGVSIRAGVLPDLGECTQVYVTVNYVSLPTVTTQAATSIGFTTAIGNGNITATGGENADIRGIVWDLASQGAPGNVAPAVSGYANDVAEAGNFGAGAFTIELSGLPKGTTIYCRAYAHNSVGYTYGAEVNFNTYGDVAVVFWAQPTSIILSVLSGAEIDLSGYDHDATPTFRTAPSDTDVSAAMASFLPIEEAQAPPWVLEEERDFWDTENITATSEFTTTPSPTTAPGVDIIVAISEASGTPSQLPFTVIAGLVILSLSLTVTWFMVKHGSRNLWLKIIMIAILMGFCIAVDVFDFWMLVFFLIMAIAVALFSRQRSTG